MRQNLLLLHDVDEVGKKGEVVSVRSGFARNYLFPQKFAVAATKHTLKMQQKLKEEREKQAVVDRQEAEELAAKIQGLIVETTVKVDPEGKMYGSVSALDIVHLFEKTGFAIDKKWVQLKKPLKTVGITEIQLKLKEGVMTSFNLKVIPELQEGLAVIEEEAKKAFEAQKKEQDSVLKE
jgi:large subunit ribosomal protein L9